MKDKHSDNGNRMVLSIDIAQDSFFFGPHFGRPWVGMIPDGLENLVAEDKALHRI